MRLVGAVLFVALAGSVAVADPPDSGDAKPSESVEPPAPAPAAAPAAAPKAKVPLRVVRMLPETQQALLFDKSHGKDVLAEVGQTIDGYKVADIDDDEVTLETASGGEVVLAAPLRWRAGVEDRRIPTSTSTSTSTGTSTGTGEPQPVDPYASDVPAISAPVAEPATVTVTSAPAPAPAVAAPPPAIAPAAPEPEVPAVTTLTRPEFNASLADFGRLAAAFHGTFVPSGVRVDGVAEGSLFARVGLRPGDVVRAVDNQPLHSLDDAAELYARAGTARNITLQVVRGGKPLTLRVAIL